MFLSLNICQIFNCSWNDIIKEYAASIRGKPSIQDSQDRSNRSWSDIIEEYGTLNRNKIISQYDMNRLSVIVTAFQDKERY